MGGSGSSTSQQYDFDQSGLAQFVATKEGSQYAGQYKPGAYYYKIGNSIQTYSPPAGAKGFNPNQMNGMPIVGADVSSMVSAYLAWKADQQNANQTWQNYADLVSKQAGGEGQDTILASATNPYQSLIAAQQNAGVVGNPNTRQPLIPSRKGLGAP